MNKPERIKYGDKVGIFLPASSVKKDYRDRGLFELKEMGFFPIESDNMFSNENYYAKDVKETFDDLIRFLNDDDIKLIWAARGGYGSNYLVEYMKNKKIEFNPKIIMGSSDVSYLLWHFLDNFDMVVFYSPMIYSSVAEKKYNKTQLLNVITGEYDEITIEGSVLNKGKVSGMVTGGCLSNFVSLIGTDYFPKIKDKILFLEDVGEKGYRLDRMFWQIENAGILKKIKGLVLGRFVNSFKNEEDEILFYENLKRRLKKYDFPVVFNLPIGHGDDLHVLPLGIRIDIDTDNYEGIKFSEKGVL